VKYRRDIEGLRAIAVIAVLLFHFGVPGMQGGYIGVDVFFVISGFLITSLLIAERSGTGRVSLRDFYARRIRRLLPISAVVLGATAIASATWLEPTRLADLAQDIRHAATFTVNTVFANRGTDYLGAELPPSPIQHYWSLAVEEQFYMLWPALIAIVTIGARNVKARVAATMAIIVVLSLAMSILLVDSHPAWTFFGLHTRAWELGLGSFLYVTYLAVRQMSVQLRARISWSGLVLIAISVVSFGGVSGFPGWIAMIPVLATCAVLIGSDDVERGPIRLLGHPVMQWVGQRSYSLYLWHWPVLIIAVAHVGDDLSAVQRLAVLSITVGLAELGHRFVENPIRRSPALVTHSRLTFCLGGSLVVVGLIVGVALGAYEPNMSTGVIASEPTFAPVVTTIPQLTTTSINGNTSVPETTTTNPKRPEYISMEQTLPIQAIVDAVPNQIVPDNLEPSLLGAKYDTSVVYENGCHQYYDTAVTEDCVFGDPNGTITIALWGDSHAAQWFEALKAIAGENGWRFLSITQGGCPFLDVLTFSSTDEADNSFCIPWRESVREYMKAEGVDVVLLSQYYELRDARDRKAIKSDVWAELLGPLLDGLRSDGIEPVVLGDTPDPPDDVPKCVSAQRNSVQSCASGEMSDAARAVDDVVRTITVERSVSFVEPRKWLCSNRICPVIVGNLLVYRDSHHISNRFMQWLTPVVADVLVPFVQQRVQSGVK
jgi:peptidoglycan/LPS O-acetylase OafA/YrhL